MGSDFDAVIRDALQMIYLGCDLNEEISGMVVRHLLSNSGDKAAIGGLLVGLNMRGETVNELVGAIRALQKYQILIENPYPTALDVGGTGGDFGATFNVSTTAAIVAAAAGAVVLKHGGVAVTGHCGSMDLVRALGLTPAGDAKTAREQIRRFHIAFLPTSSYLNIPWDLQEIRSALGIPTLFNLIAPWCNPACPECQIIGVSRPRYIPIFGAVAQRLQRKRVLILHDVNGATDEFALSGPTAVVDVSNGVAQEYHVTPADFGYPDSPRDAIKSLDLKSNVGLTKAVLEGHDHGPARRIVTMTASACLYICGMEKTLCSGINRVESTLDSGQAAGLLRAMVQD